MPSATTMNDDLFNDLCASIEEAGAHLRGELDLPPEQIHVVGEPDPRAIRTHLDLTQAQFAALLDVPVATVRNWEQGRRRPRGPAKTLLKVAARRPEALLELFREQQAVA
jgi:putative transcriptional regulator